MALLKARLHNKALQLWGALQPLRKRLLSPRRRRRRRRRRNRRKKKKMKEEEEQEQERKQGRSSGRRIERRRISLLLGFREPFLEAEEIPTKTTIFFCWATAPSRRAASRGAKRRRPGAPCKAI
jgi:hypothetical protein